MTIARNISVMLAIVIGFFFPFLENAKFLSDYSVEAVPQAQAIGSAEFTRLTLRFI